MSALPYLYFTCMKNAVLQLFKRPAVFLFGVFWLTLMILAGLGILGVFLRSAWCRYLCPYGALLGLLSWASPAFGVIRWPIGSWWANSGSKRVVLATIVHRAAS